MTACCLCLGVSPLLAQDLPAENSAAAPKTDRAPFPDLKWTLSGRVDQVIDGLTFTLKDGKIVRLSAIDVPDFAQPQGDIAFRAFQLARTLLPEGTEVALYQTRQARTGRENRMGQLLAHVYIERENVWMQGALLAEGLARAMPGDANPEMTREMFIMEQKARAAQKGIWAEGSSYRLQTPDMLADKTGSVQVVEGTILKTASVKNNIYLNFGADWRTDFTVRISPAIRREMSRKQINPLDLQGKTIRVRGYVEDYNGPMITLETIHHLEILDGTPSAR